MMLGVVTCQKSIVSLLCEKCADPAIPRSGDPAILDFHCAEKKLK
jgi:hypothetical protein